MVKAETPCQSKHLSFHFKNLRGLKHGLDLKPLTHLHGVALYGLWSLTTALVLPQSAHLEVLDR
jgi:hypothetical protein